MDKRKKALQKVMDREALLLIGSPVCTSFSRLQHMNFHKMDEKKKADMIREGRTYLDFCMMLYELQADNGLYFFHDEA